MSRFVTHAKWPFGLYRQPGYASITTDTHETREEAEAVCRLLEKEGYSGEGDWFPVRTWITEEKV